MIVQVSILFLLRIFDFIHVTAKFATCVLILLVSLFFLSCVDDPEEEEKIPNLDYKQKMREFVQDISSYARNIDSDFVVIPQNGHELLTSNGDEGGNISADYINAIDGIGREDLFYGYNDDNQLTPSNDRDYMLAFMDIARENGLRVLVTDYCWDHSKMDSSYSWNAAKRYISFAADKRELNNIPNYPSMPFKENDDEITSLKEAKNFLYLLDPSLFTNKQAFITAVQATNYDVIIIDMFDSDDVQFTKSDISALTRKQNGGTRLVISYMSIGEAENYRYYWNSKWKVGTPSWIGKENPDWSGNYKVRYWDSEWKNIIYGNDESYLKKILEAGFDGVYLDIIDAFEYFE